eukprot:5091954-Lingulodinium_polyedra.AAC.1
MHSEFFASQRDSVLTMDKQRDQNVGRLPGSLAAKVVSVPKDIYQEVDAVLKIAQIDIYFAQ